MVKNDKSFLIINIVLKDRMVFNLKSLYYTRLIGGFYIPKKRKSHGRNKGKSGNPGFVQCSHCGKHVPRDKAKKVTKNVSFIDFQIVKELRSKGTYIPRQQVINYYCISCAVHRRVVKVRAKADRKSRIPQ